MSVDKASDSKKLVPNENEKAKIEEVKKLIGPTASKFSRECSDESIIRYLTARSWNTKRAAKMLLQTLRWRMEFNPDKIQWDDIAHEAATGKVYRANYVDKHGRTVLVMRPGQQNPNPVEEQVKCLVYCFENAIANLQNDQEQMVWLIDFEKWNMACISLRVTRDTARILQDHYPARLGIAILYNPPRVFKSFWLLVKPFLEPKTYKKVKFVYSSEPESMKIMEAIFDMDKLESTFGGKGKESFVFESYAKRMKDEEKQRFSCNGKNSGDHTELQGSDALVSDARSKIPDEVDPSHHRETSSDLEALGEMERGLPKDKPDECQGIPDDMHNDKGKVDVATEVNKT